MCCRIWMICRLGCGWSGGGGGGGASGLVLRTLKATAIEGCSSSTSLSRSWKLLLRSNWTYLSLFMSIWFDGVTSHFVWLWWMSVASPAPRGDGFLCCSRKMNTLASASKEFIPRISSSPVLFTRQWGYGVLVSASRELIGDIYPHGFPPPIRNQVYLHSNRGLCVRLNRGRVSSHF